MITYNRVGLLFILITCIFTCETYSFENGEEETFDDAVMESSNMFFADQHLPTNEPVNKKLSLFFNNRRSESAEKYFNWVGKTHRPVEYLRGKRFWLFAKKDEHDMNIEPLQNMKTQQSSLAQGLWRSGIVGRRRR